MSKKIRDGFLRVEDIKNAPFPSSNDMHYTALFVINNKDHIDLFFPIQRYMHDFKIVYVNLMCWGKRRYEIENCLYSQNIPYVTINNLFNKIDLLLQSMKPDIIILGHDTNPPNQKIIQSAKKLDIPTLIIQDGIYGDERVLRQSKKTLADKIVKIPGLLSDNQYSPLEKLEIIVDDIKSMVVKRQFVGRGEYSNIAVFGNATKELLEREGVDPRKIILTGSPKFDYLRSHTPTEGYLTRQNLGVPPNKRIITLITQPLVESGIWSQRQREDYISRVWKTVKKFNDCQLIIKFRQGRENSRDYEDISKFSGIDAIICGDVALYKLISISEVVLTVYSTGGIEAIAAEKPLIIFDPFNTPGSSFYNSRNILFLNNDDDLYSTLDKIMSDHFFLENVIRKQNIFLEENIFKNDGRSAERIYNQIINMIKNKV